MMMNPDLLENIFHMLKAEGVEDPAYQGLVAGLITQIREKTLRSIGVSGSQGSGKSTIARVLKKVLEDDGRTRVAILSLDDFYKTRSERLAMQAEHPLFAVRGVPGTHDVQAMVAAKKALLAGRRASIPVFDKGQDDRVGMIEVEAGVDIVLLEGWCLGARPEPSERLQAPINALEATRDRHGHWRRRVNAYLASEDYQSLFEVDYLVYFKAPSFDAILDWRVAQERQFNQGPRAMSREQLREFIGYYQRLTEWMMIEMAGRADLVAALNTDHGLAQIVNND